MKKVKKYQNQCCFAMVLLTIVLLFNSFAGSIEHVTEIAESGYKSFIHHPLKNESFCKQHGISVQDLEGPIQLGKPVHLISLSDAEIAAYTFERPVADIGQETEIYMFPLLFNGKPKLFLDVGTYGTNRFEIGSLGQSELCNEVGKVWARYTTQKGYSMVLFQNYHTQKYFFHIPQLYTNNLTLLSSEESKKRNGYATLTTAKESLSILQQLLNELKK